MADGGAEFNVYNVLSGQLAGIETRLTRRLDDIARGQLDYVKQITLLEGRVAAIEADADEQRDDRKWMKRMVISAIVTALILPFVVGLVLAVVLAS